MANRYATQGGALYLKIVSTWTLIDGVDAITPSGGERQTISATAINDSASKTVAGIPADVSMEGELFYDPLDTAHLAVLALRASGANAEWRWAYPAAIATATRVVWTGQVADFSPQFGVNNAALKSKLKILVATGPTQEAGTGTGV